MSLAVPVFRLLLRVTGVTWEIKKKTQRTHYLAAFFFPAFRILLPMFVVG